jgi:hypothetical protein
MITVNNLALLLVLASTASAAASAATTSSNARAAASTTYSTDDILYEDGTGKVLYSYYRSGNFHNAVDVGASGDGSARAVSWDYTYSIFDSKRESYVMRYDIDTGGSSASTSTAVTLQDGDDSKKIYLSFPNAFLFTTSPSATITDAKTGESRSFAPDSMAYINSGACVSLSVTADTSSSSSSSSSSNVTIMVVSAGPFNSTAFLADSSDCADLDSLVGYDELHNNPIDYVSNGTCDKTLGGPGGAADYDNLDDPIQPLQAHYHSRGALYYTATGTSQYDTDVTGLEAGELRFVNEGYYYGPETMDPWPGTTVLSLHEPDADAIVTSASTSTSANGAGPDYTPCAFACLDTPEQTAGKTTLRCVAP